ncbi:MAG: divergent PAP2 family protein [Oscillospiraceae bacterium]|nr:divergent PAP2 family protein [Oscillospiraceae bacterium]
MTVIKDIFANNIIATCTIAWATAQVLKTLINFVITKKFNAERLVGAGGMPSAHSAFVCSLAVATAKECGVSSPVFAVAAALAVIVMYDAMGVRRAAGEQAKTINILTDAIEKAFGTPEIVNEQLKEFLGHTPVEVVAGALLGIFIARIR